MDTLSHAVQSLHLSQYEWKDKGMSSFLMQYVDSGENTFECVSKVFLVVSNAFHRRGISRELPSVYNWTFLTNELGEQRTPRVSTLRWFQLGTGQLGEGFETGPGEFLPWVCSSWRPASECLVKCDHSLYNM